MKNKTKRGFLDISFSWIFAIMIGGIILVGAIYGLTKFTSSENAIQNVEGAKEISVLLNPLETDFEQGKSVLIQMPVETRIYTSCSEVPDFGDQGLSLSEYIKGEWSKRGAEVFSNTKYLYSNKITQGKNFYLFSKPFEIPFKVASLIYLIPEEKEYCFKEAPRKIENEIKRLNQPNLKVKDCSESSISVCFEDKSCDINVEENFVEKEGEKLYYERDSLMYAAIFSDKNIYECNSKRLMYRVSSLAEIYQEKNNLLFKKGCKINLVGNLQNLKDFADNFESSEDFQNFGIILDLIENEGRYSDCKLW